MDWLRFFIAVWSVMLVLNMAGSIMLVGKPREPYTPGGVGCSFLITIPILVLMLLTWVRLGAGGG